MALLEAANQEVLHNTQCTQYTAFYILQNKNRTLHTVLEHIHISVYIVTYKVEEESELMMDNFLASGGNLEEFLEQVLFCTEL